MCLIIAPGKDGTPALLPREVFDYTYSRNNDGFGAMWIEDGRVNHFKTLNMSKDEIYGTMEEYVERYPDVIFHMRLKTHGRIIPGLSHPFRILNKKRHGKDLFFMHNGILGSFGNNLKYGQSDTTVFKDKVLIPLLTRDPDALEDPEVWEAINKLTSGSRLVFLDSEGKTYFSSESSWNNRYGLKLSNTYMLPPERYVGNVSSTTNNSSSGTGIIGDKNAPTTVTSHFVYFRRISQGSVEYGSWCSCPKEGYVRTDSGKLYKDNGVNKTIWHEMDYIPKDKEFEHLGLALVSNGVKTETYYDPVNDAVPFEDDELPWKDDAVAEDTIEVENTGPAPVDQRLRYARIVHNTYGGMVTSRPQLVADLVGMNEDEMSDFILEDPQNAHTIMAELVEMVLEYNDALWAIDCNHEKILNADIIIGLGQTESHQEAMKEISRLRRIKYEEELKKIVPSEHKESECDCHQCKLELEEVNVA